MNKQRWATGIALLNLSAWIRRQPWLRVIYRHFPEGLRSWTSGALAAHASEQLKFKRTENWGRANRSPKAVVASRRGTSSDAAGVDIFAHVHGQFGLAEGARLYAWALLEEGYPVAVHDIDIDVPHGMDDHSLGTHIGGEAAHEVNLVFVNPDYLEQAMANIERDRLGGRYTIACWFWELEKFPDEWRHALQWVDEVMVSTGFIRHAVAEVTDKPVWSVPLPVSQSPDSGLVRADFGLEEDDFVFLCSFDFNSYVERKNPEAAIEAFRRAFADRRPNVKLLVKSSNGHRHLEKLRVLLNVVGADERIIVRDEIIGRAELGALQRCADAYVSLHRAEGFGLGLAECMRLGKPVIATAWSGNMEFMTPENSCLVDYRLVPVEEGEYPHHAGQRWAEPDVDHAARLMRRLVEDPALATSIGARAAQDIRTRLSPHAVAQEIIRRIESRPSRSDSPALATGHPDSMNQQEQAP